jgi:hypothetical protein
LLIAALIIPFLGLAWGGEALYDGWRVSSGPNAWFLVGTPVAVYRQSHAASEFVFTFNPYATERDCDKALNRLPFVRGAPIIAGCRRLLLSDAAQMLQH